MKIQVIDDINNHFLVAMPKILGELFARSVLYMYQHDEEGSMGFVINKPMPITLGDILKQLNYTLTSDKANSIPIMQGGPVAAEQLYIIQYRDKKKKKKETDTALIQTEDLLHSFAAGKNLDNILPFLGYSGWTDNQLDDEIKNNDWLICPANQTLLFDTAPEQCWAKAIELLGIDLTLLSEDAGHA
jgi:putative transcriptional regulator